MIITSLHMALACPQKMAMITGGTNEKRQPGESGWREERTSMGRVAQRATVVKSAMPKLGEIASRIDAHLKRFAVDPAINKIAGRHGEAGYYHSSAYTAGRYVRVRYVSYRNTVSLSKPAALAYLAWLDDGNVGKHLNVPELVGS